MDLILLNDGLYHLVEVTKEMTKGIELLSEVNCFDLCDILRIKLSGYVDTLNLHIMNDVSRGVESHRRTQTIEMTDATPQHLKNERSMVKGLSLIHI